jgi:hypothetical protein
MEPLDGVRDFAPIGFDHRKDIQAGQGGRKRLSLVGCDNDERTLLGHLLEPE